MPAVTARLPDRIAIGVLTRTFPPELLALDGTTLDGAETPANVARSAGPVGAGAFPQVRLVGLVECGTHAVVDAAMGGLHLGEGSLALSLARSLGPGMLLVDQGLCSLQLWRILHATGRSWCGAAARM